ncbi:MULTISPECIES: SGNH/GDSL hydrolase family protein [unclassified Massilia]|uniref:SGNH/GDSL hydrolase family protein n=1 Tax=unclassified Massilia TaxID=2609279 RepID=UPI00177BB312|nr:MULTISPECIES: SGNH/GDSL hydrolase family protein [unclassified Massilia]MBD8532739.1 SGNH/GDSL hydrolase family protein [Massilia sp. CFBP 13647]MBD8676144.1 SGNH/GDSL hydrolase family protein [Massilia sp. CFBP 13721]
MRQTNFALALLTAAALAACGGTGSEGGDQTHKVAFTQQVSFGDSLSDVGTYKVGAIAAAGGGAFTINGDNTSANPAYTGLNWTEVLAAELNLPKPCAAQTGLQGVDNANPALDFNVPVVNYSNCYNYAQGGSRVTDPVGSHHRTNDPQVGQLTVPLVTQIANHLTKSGGKFSGTELVTVMSGGNDVLMQLGALSAGATAAGQAEGQRQFPTLLITGLVATVPAANRAAAPAAITQAVQGAAATGGNQQAIAAAAVGAAARLGATLADAQAAAAKAGTDAQAAGAAAGAAYATAQGPTLVAALGRAGAEMAALVKTQIVAKGANYVVVNNLPDVASTPSGKSQAPATQELIKAMVDTFNAQLKAGLGDDPKIAYVDLFSVSRDQVANPAIYGLTNTALKACTSDSSLTCTSKTLSGPDVSHYMFADDIHPTPYEYWLVTRYVLKDMAVKGWL